MFQRRRRHSDFAEEIECHVAIEADRLQSEGMPEADARARAQKAFGNTARAREDFYDAGRPLWWDHLRLDVLYGLRNLRKTPAFTLAAILTLALGIGANTALFSVIDNVLIRPLPYPDANKLVMLYGRLPNGGTEGPSPADFLDYRRQSSSFESLAAFREMPFNFTGGDRPERIEGAVVTPDFFAVMKTDAQLGRPFIPAIDKPGSRVVVLSYSLWREKFNSDPRILGRPIEINGEPRTVVGVMPQPFQFPLSCQVWSLSQFAVVEQPLAPRVDQSNSRDSHYFDAIGRLKPNVTLAQATAETEVIAKRLKRQFGENEEAVGSALTGLHEDLTGQTRPMLLLLLGGVGLLLLIACANVANLLLARGSSRQRELAVRAALGASRSRIVRQLLAESLLLAAGGGVLGIYVAYLARIPLNLFTPPEMLLGVTPGIDLRILAFTLALSLASGVVFGVIPALHYSRVDLNGMLKDGARGSTNGAAAGKAQSALMISEVAFATLLLISAGLLIRSFLQLMAAPQGFDPENVLSAELTFSPARYPAPANRVTFVNQALEHIRALPGITSAAVSSRLPLNHGNSRRGISVAGGPRYPEDELDIDYIAVSPDYFQTLGIPVLKGRAFTPNDKPGTAPVVIVNDAAARLLWPDKDPLTGLVTAGACGNDKQLCRVVGVTGNVRQHNLAVPAVPAVYVPYARDPWPFLAIIVHSRISPLSAAHDVEAAIHRLDKDQPLFHIRAMRDVVSDSLSARRFRMVLLALFAGLALLLGCIGIYGVMAYAVAQRSAEIGIRMALGAKSRDVLLLVIGSGMRRVVTGALIGSVASIWTNGLLASALYGIRRTDAVTLTVTFFVLIAVALFATSIPALRATRIDPVQSLRAE